MLDTVKILERQNAPAIVDAVNFKLQLKPYKKFTLDNGVDVRLTPTWRSAPRSLVFHLPWFVRGVSTVAAGQVVPIAEG